MCFGYTYVPVIVGPKAIEILSDRVSLVYVQTQLMVDDNTWPPEKPTGFILPLLTHYKGQRTPREVETMAKRMYGGNIGEVASMPDTVADDSHSAVKHVTPDKHTIQEAFDSSTATNKIAEILAPLEKGKEASFILIEGAPGIGKSKKLHTSGVKSKYYKSLN